MGSVSWRKRGHRYLVSWRLDDGSQGGKTVDTPDEARDLAAEKRLEMRRGTWRGRQRGRLAFNAWAAEWWETWAADDPSPTTLAATESWLRLHVRPWFADRPIDKITPADVRRWQAQLARNVGPSTVAHCRSLALRIFQHAMDEGAIDTNPVRKVPRSSAGLIPSRSLVRASDAPSLLRRPGACWRVSRCSGGTMCSPCSAPAYVSASWPGYAGVGSISTVLCPCSRSVPPA